MIRFGMFTLLVAAVLVGAVSVAQEKPDVTEDPKENSAIEQSPKPATPEDAPPTSNGPPVAPVQGFGEPWSPTNPPTNLQSLAGDLKQVKEIWLKIQPETEPTNPDAKDAEFRFPVPADTNLKVLAETIQWYPFRYIRIELNDTLVLRVVVKTTDAVKLAGSLAEVLFANAGEQAKNPDGKTVGLSSGQTADVLLDQPTLSRILMNANRVSATLGTYNFIVTLPARLDRDALGIRLWMLNAVEGEELRFLDGGNQTVVVLTPVTRAKELARRITEDLVAFYQQKPNVPRIRKQPAAGADDAGDPMSAGANNPLGSDPAAMASPPANANTAPDNRIQLLVDPFARDPKVTTQLIYNLMDLKLGVQAPQPKENCALEVRLLVPEKEKFETLEKFVRVLVESGVEQLTLRENDRDELAVTVIADGQRVSAARLIQLTRNLEIFRDQHGVAVTYSLNTRDDSTPVNPMAPDASSMMGMGSSMGSTPPPGGASDSGMSSMMMGSGPPETVTGLKARYAQLEGQIAELARKIRESRNPTTAQIQPLRELVTEAFRVRQRQQQLELAEFRQRMARVEKTIQARAQSRQRIIDRRVEELVNPDVQWDSAPPSHDGAMPIPGHGAMHGRHDPMSTMHGAMPRAGHSATPPSGHSATSSRMHGIPPTTSMPATSSKKSKRRPPSNPQNPAEGEWVLESIQGGGVLGWETNLKVRVEDATWTVVRGNQETSYTMTLGSKTNSIDLSRADAKPSTMRGLIRFRGGKMQVFWSTSNNAVRPKDFDDPGANMHTYRRTDAVSLSDEQKRFDGRWRRVRESLAGKEIQQREPVWRVIERLRTDEVEYRINPTASPREVDSVSLRDPSNVRVGIYEWRASPTGQLQLCFAFVGNSSYRTRPQDFQPAPRVYTSVWEREPDETPSANPLHGKWKLESVTGEGVSAPPGERTVLVDSESYRVFSDDKLQTTYSLILDPTANYPRIDLVPEATKGKSEILRGLYKVEGDKLQTFWITKNPSTPPVSYDAEGVIVQTFRKVVEGEAAAPAAQSSRNPMDGRWALLKITGAFEAGPESGQQLEIDGESWTRLVVGTTAKSRIEIVKDVPGGFDLSHTDDKGVTHTSRGLYRVEGETLTLYWMHGSTSERPKTPETATSVETYRRVAPSAADAATAAVEAEARAKLPATVDPEARSVRLTFVGGDKKHPVPDLTIRLWRVDAKLGRVKAGIIETDDQGVATTRLVPAHYVAKPESDTALHYLPIPVGWKEHPAFSGFNFTVAADEKEQPFELHLSAPCELTLKAVDEDGKGLAGAVFATENAVGEYWAQVINADTLGSPQLRESDFTDETLQTDSKGEFSRELGPRPGWKYMVWISPKGYEPVEPGKEVDVETPLGQAQAEYTFRFRKKATAE